MNQNKTSPEHDFIIEVEKGDIDQLHEINKFNPYHDARGRFSSADGYATFTFRTKDPKKQHMADMAVAREKERKAKAGERIDPASRPKDPETIGGVTRGDPMTRDEADNKNTNPKFMQERGYDTNCQSCVVAYEARLRGYDVEAKSRLNNFDAGMVAHNSTLAWIDPETGRPPKLIRNGKDVKTPKQCKDWIEETVKPGERYTFEHEWKGRDYYGHIICVDRAPSGKLRFFDPQSGKTMMGADIDNYLSGVKVSHTYRSGWRKGQTSSRGGLQRIDNLQINPGYANGIMEGKKR